MSTRTDPDLPWNRPVYRDRHGRGQGRCSAAGCALPHQAGLFDDMYLAEIRRLRTAWPQVIDSVQCLVEDVPPDDPLPWEEQRVPRSQVFPAEHGRPARIVLYRRPLETESYDARDLEASIRAELVGRVADLTGRRPDEIDPSQDDGTETADQSEFSPPPTAARGERTASTVEISGMSEVEQDHRALRREACARAGAGEDSGPEPVTLRRRRPRRMPPCTGGTVATTPETRTSRRGRASCRMLERAGIRTVLPSRGCRRRRPRRRTRTAAGIVATTTSADRPSSRAIAEISCPLRARMRE